MPIVNFSSEEKGNFFSLLPEGRYKCRIVNIVEDQTRGGFAWWRIRYEVIAGKYTGRIIYDNLFFNNFGLKQIKNICTALSIVATGEFEMTPDIILGRKLILVVNIVEFEDRNREIVLGNDISPSGYKKLPDDTDNLPEIGTENEDDLPF